MGWYAGEVNRYVLPVNRQWSYLIRILSGGFFCFWVYDALWRIPDWEIAYRPFWEVVFEWFWLNFILLPTLRRRVRWCLDPKTRVVLLRFLWLRAHCHCVFLRWGLRVAVIIRWRSLDQACCFRTSWSEFYRLDSWIILVLLKTKVWSRGFRWILPNGTILQFWGSRQMYSGNRKNSVSYRKWDLLPD